MKRRLRIELDEGAYQRLYFNEPVGLYVDFDGESVCVEFRRTHVPTPQGTVVKPVAAIPIKDVLNSASAYSRVMAEFEPPVWVERRSRKLLIFDREPPAEYISQTAFWKWDPSQPTAALDVCANHASLPRSGWHTVVIP